VGIPRRRRAGTAMPPAPPTPPSGPFRLPPPVSVDLATPVRELFIDRVRQSVFDTYAGVPMLKFPEDLRVYEHILFSQRVAVVLELGVQQGGSSLWFRDRLRTLAGYGLIAEPQVIGVDIDLSEAHRYLDPAFMSGITLIEGDVRDPATAEQVHRLIAPGSSCLVVEDSAHTYETTMAALGAFSDLVQPDGYFVVEDGCVDIEEMRLHPDWPRGVLPAIHEWLASPAGAGFRQRRDMELYGVTAHPEGFLQRVPAPS
jgi:cephalosporin hydroxylase